MANKKPLGIYNGLISEILLTDSLLLGTIAQGVWNGTAVTPQYGGTGLISLTPYTLLAGGTTSTGNLQQVSGTGTSGQTLVSNGPSVLPTWQNTGSYFPSSVSNIDGSLNISPNIGAVIASLNVAHANIWTAAQTIIKTAVGLGNTTALLLQNTTSAAAGSSNQQYSPSLQIEGQGWNTSALASQAVDFKIYESITQGNPPLGSLLFAYSENGGAYSTLYTFDSLSNVIFSSGNMLITTSSAGTGQVSLSNSGNTAPGFFQTVTSGGLYANTVSATAQSILTLGLYPSLTVANTSGTMYLVNFELSSFAPTSGTGGLVMLNVAPTINQTGGASGITRGIYINPTTTAAADWRAIEIINGKSIFQFVGVGGLNPTGNGYLQIAANTSTNAQMILSSGTTNVTSPVGGMLWWNGTNLYFNNGVTNKDLLVGTTYSADGTTLLLTGTTFSINLANPNTWTGIQTFNPTVSSSAGLGREHIITGTLTATANNDVLIGLDIAPTYTNGAFTGVENAAIRAKGDIIPSSNDIYNLGTNSLAWANVFTGNLTTVSIAGFGDIAFYNASSVLIGKWFNATGNLLIQDGGTFIDHNARLQLAAASSTDAQIYLASGSTNVASPIAGMLWWNGVNLYFNNGTTNKDLLASGGGAVSSVSNSDSSLTISPTTGAVIASLNPAHANSWTGVQTFNPTVSASAGLAQGNVIDGTLTAAANNDILAALDIAPTFTNGAFTNVTDAAIRVAGKIIPAADGTYDIGQSGTTSRRFNNAFLLTVFSQNIRSVGNGTGLTFTNATGTQIGEFFDTTGNFIIQNGGTFTDNNARLQLAAASSTDAQIYLASGTTNVSSPSAGMLWWNGVNLYFNNGTTNSDLLASLTNPMTTAGDIIIGGTSGTPTRLAIGTSGQALTVISGAPEWFPVVNSTSSDGSISGVGSGVLTLIVNTAHTNTWTVVQNIATPVTNSTAVNGLTVYNAGAGSGTGAGIRLGYGNSTNDTAFIYGYYDGTLNAVDIGFQSNSGNLVATMFQGGINIGSSTTLVAALGLPAGTALLPPVKYTSSSAVLLTTPVQGGDEVDSNGLRYYTNEATAGRGTVTAEQRFRLTSNGGTISTIANFFGSTSNPTLVSGAEYEIEIDMYYTNTTAGTVTFTFTNSAAPTLQNIHARFSPVAGIVAPAGSAAATYLEGDIQGNTTAAEALTTTGSLTTGTTQWAHFSIRLINGTGTSLKIQATKLVGGTITPLAGSYWTCRRVPAANVGIFSA